MFGENAMDRSAADHARAIALPFAGKAPFGRKLVRDRFRLAGEHAKASIIFFGFAAATAAVLPRSENARQQHRDPVAVPPILVAKKRHQIAFLKIDSDEDVGCRDEGK